MSKFILTFLCAIFTLSGFSQYLPMLVDERTWYTRLDGQTGTTTQILAIELDSVNSNIRYAHLVEKDASLQVIDTVAVLLEDTLAGSVFIDNVDNTVYDQFYDFSLQLNDTLFFKSPFSGDTSKVKVDSVFTYTDMQGVNRKALKFKNFPGDSCVSTPKFWIEGFGSTAFLEYPQPECALVPEVFAVLQCVFDGNTKLYGDTISKCYKIGLVEREMYNFTVYPNPAKDVIFIELKDEVSASKVQVRMYNSTGKLVKALTSTDSLTSVKLNDLSPGVYFMTILADDEVNRLKVMVE